MFWGLIMEPSKRYTQTVEKAFHLSMASLDATTASGDFVQVMIRYDESNYLLCTLQKDKTWQVPLDLNFEQGSKISFTCNGDGHVHLTGYIIADDDEEDIMGASDSDDEEESEEDEAQRKIAELLANKKRKAINGTSKQNKKPKVEIEFDEDSDDDSDVDDSDLDVSGMMEVEDDQASDDDSDEDDEEDEDSDDDDDSDEDDEEDDEDEEEQVPVKETKNQKQKQNQNQNQSKNKQNQQQNQSQNKDQSAKNKMVNGKDSQQEQQKNKQQKKNKAENKNENGKAEKPQQQEQQLKKTTINGVQIEDLKAAPGNGPVAKSGKFVTVYYKGSFKNGKLFDSCTSGPGFKFRLGKGEVIQGWDIGVAGMKVGSKRRLVIPPKMGYGAKGSPPVIPGNSTLYFEIELKAVH